MNASPNYQIVSRFKCFRTAAGCDPGEGRCHWVDDMATLTLPFPECQGTGGNCP